MSTARSVLLALLSSSPAFAEQTTPLRLFNALAPCVEIDRLELLPGDPPKLRGRFQLRRHRGECGCTSALVAYELLAQSRPGQTLTQGRFLPRADGWLLLDLPATGEFDQATRVRFSCAAAE